MKSIYKQIVDEGREKYNRTVEDDRKWILTSGNYDDVMNKLHSFGVTDDMWETIPYVSGNIIVNWKGKKFYVGLSQGKIRNDGSDKWYWLSKVFFK